MSTRGSRRRKYRQQQANEVQTPLVPPPPNPDAAEIPLGELEKDEVFRKSARAALLSLVIAVLLYAGWAWGEEPLPPMDVVDSTQVVDAPVVEEEKPGRLRNAIRYLFKADSSAIMSEAEADYNDRVLALEARERDVSELERILREEEATLISEQQSAETQTATIEARIKALTKCVAVAMDEPIGGGP